MKRIAIVLSISFLLAACGSKAKPASTAPDNKAEQTEAMPAGDGAAPGDPASDEGGGGATKGAPPAPDADDPCGGGE